MSDIGLVASSSGKMMLSLKGSKLSPNASSPQNGIFEDWQVITRSFGLDSLKICRVPLPAPQQAFSTPINRSVTATDEVPPQSVFTSRILTGRIGSTWGVGSCRRLAAQPSHPDAMAIVQMIPYWTTLRSKVLLNARVVSLWRG
jgi:hypothetical protein